MFRFLGVTVLVCSLSLHSVPTWSQQSTPPPESGAALLQHSLAVQLRGTRISDVTLTGTVRRIVGSDDESGPATLKALHSGESRVELNLTRGAFTEASSVSDGPHGFWRGPDAKSYAVAEHNLYTNSSWFFPALLLQRALLSPHRVITDHGEESRDDRALLHLTIVRKFPEMPAETAGTFEQLSKMELFFDPSTHLLVAITFNTHPDDNLLVDIPVEIRFSDYRIVDGVQIPFHVEKHVNNSLFLDLHLEKAVLNSGLVAAQVGAQ